jgi:hypothetical protein
MHTTEPTIEDVARLAGVSRATASRVLNDFTGTRTASVPEDTDPTDDSYTMTRGAGRRLRHPEVVLQDQEHLLRRIAGHHRTVGRHGDRGFAGGAAEAR